MSKFQPGNPGRPVGSKRERADSVIAKCRQYLSPFAAELIERSVESALAGDKAALVAVLHLYASLLSASTAELQAKLARHKRPSVNAAPAEAALKSSSGWRGSLSDSGGDDGAQQDIEVPLSGNFGQSYEGGSYA